MATVEGLLQVLDQNRQEPIVSAEELEALEERAQGRGEGRCNEENLCQVGLGMTGGSYNIFVIEVRSATGPTLAGSTRGGTGGDDVS